MATYLIILITNQLLLKEAMHKFTQKYDIYKYMYVILKKCKWTYQDLLMVTYRWGDWVELQHDISVHITFI